MNAEYRFVPFTPMGADAGALALGRKSAYDPELLYVECRFCGKPVLWEQGKTRLLITASGLDSDSLDEHCLILSDGCTACRPGNGHFQLHMVRLAVFSPQDILLLSDGKGNA